MSQNSGFLVHRLADTFSTFWGLCQNPGFLVHRLADSKATISDFWYIDWRIPLPLLKSGSSTWLICSPCALAMWRFVSPDSIRGCYYSAKCDVPSCRGGAGADAPLPRTSVAVRLRVPAATPPWRFPVRLEWRGGPRGAGHICGGGPPRPASVAPRSRRGLRSPSREGGLILPPPGQSGGPCRGASRATAAWAPWALAGPECRQCRWCAR